MDNQAEYFIKKRFYRTRFASNLNIRPKFEDFHLLETLKDCDYPIHQHQNYEIILVEKGPYLCRINDVEIELKDGEIVIIKPGDWHQDHLREGQRHYVVHFRLTSNRDIEEVDYSIFAKNISPVRQISQVLFSEEIHLNIHELAKEADNRFPYSASVQDTLLELMFWRIIRGLNESFLSSTFRQLSKDQSFIERFNRIIKENLRKNLKLAEIAESMDISKRTLYSKCNTLIGAPPAQAYMLIKIEVASSMLRHTNMAIKEISFELGFRNQYHFSRVFKQFTGIPPSKYRVAKTVN